MTHSCRYYAFRSNKKPEQPVCPGNVTHSKVCEHLPTYCGFVPFRKRKCFCQYFNEHIHHHVTPISGVVCCRVGLRALSDQLALCYFVVTVVMTVSRQVNGWTGTHWKHHLFPLNRRKRAKSWSVITSRILHNPTNFKARRTDWSGHIHCSGSSSCDCTLWLSTELLLSDSMYSPVQHVS